MADLVLSRDLDRDEIRRRRILLGFSQVDFAAVVPTGVTYLNEIEKGNATPSPALLKKIADALGCTTADLVRDEPVAAS